MINKRFPDIRSAWEHMYDAIIADKEGVIDNYQRNIVHSYNNTVQVKSAVFDFDLGAVGMTKTKWTKFTNQYVDQETLHAWIDSAKGIKTYDSLWMFKTVPPNFGGRRAVHRWGNCLLAFTFRRKPIPTLTYFTRAQSLGFSGVADYALCDFVARQFALKLGIPQEKIRLNIYCPNFFLKTVETIHTLSIRHELSGDPHDVMELDVYKDTSDRMRNSMDYYISYLNRDPADIPWRAAKRMRQKLEKLKNGTLPVLPVSELTLGNWDYWEGQARKMSTSERSHLILTGKGAFGAGMLEEDEIEAEEMEFDDGDGF